jgi:hypothetical protein
VILTGQRVLDKRTLREFDELRLAFELFYRLNKHANKHRAKP